jgi:isoleucyl-tRNA synthetase
VPYAQVHYPFEGKEKFFDGFPADFIAEGLDQTRGWFYTLLVISTALFDQPPFKNLVVNGLVLGSDGKKMSKRLKNYPDPMDIVNKFGADALRLYLIDSPVVRAEPLKFQTAGVKTVLRDVFLRWYNAYRFFVQNVHRIESEKRVFTLDSSSIHQTNNVMDKWVLSYLQSLIEFVRKEMAAYQLYTVIPMLVKFIESLANWYVRLNRPRLKGSKKDPMEEHLALNTLHHVIHTLCRVMAPFTPFFTEYIYQNLREIDPPETREDRVHYLSFPEVCQSLKNPQIERSVSRMQEVIELGRYARDHRKLPFKTPLSQVIIYQKDTEYLEDIATLEYYILKELNVGKIELKKESGEGAVVLKAKPDKKRLGTRLRGEFAAVEKQLEHLSNQQLEAFETSGKIVVCGHELTNQDLQIVREFAGDPKRYEAAWSSNVLVVLDVFLTPDLEREGYKREIVNRIQRLRKSAKLLQTNSNVSVYYKLAGKGAACKTLLDILAKDKTSLEEETKTRILQASKDEPKNLKTISGTSIISCEVNFTLNLYWNE